MNGWKFIEEDDAWHYFINGTSACSIFRAKKAMEPRRPHVPDCCQKCLSSAPADSYQNPPPEAQ